MLNGGDSILSTLSVAVVDGGYFSVGGPAQAIESYLLVDSELKGAIESPASYFYDSGSITSQEKLDLLVMVQGWRSYYWGGIVEKAPEGTAGLDSMGWADAGVSVGGRVKYMFRGKPVIGGKVVFGPYSRNFLFEQAKTDSLGRFRFSHLYLEDTASVIVDAWTPAGRRNAQILPEPGLQYDPVLAVAPINRTVSSLGTPRKYAVYATQKLMAQDKFDADMGGILLKEVSVVEKKYSKNEEFYELVKPFNIEPERSLTITKDDYIDFSSIVEYLDWKYPPWRYKNTLILLDGIKLGTQFTENILEHMEVDEVYKVEIFFGGTAAAGQGSSGIDRVISIYTKWERDEFKPPRWAMSLS